MILFSILITNFPPLVCFRTPHRFPVDLNQPVLFGNGKTCKCFSMHSQEVFRNPTFQHLFPTARPTLRPIHCSLLMLMPRARLFLKKNFPPPCLYRRCQAPILKITTTTARTRRLPTHRVSIERLRTMDRFFKKFFFRSGRRRSRFYRRELWGSLARSRRSKKKQNA